MGVRRVAAGAAVVALASALAGCAGSGPGGTTTTVPAGDHIHGNRLTIYIAGPLSGRSRVSGRAVVNGATLALDQIGSRIGRYRILMRTLDDVSPGQHEWSAAATQVAAQTAANDHTTIAYLGDFNSGASGVSIPVLNPSGIAQVSPYSSAVGLTSDGPGSSPGEPQAFYPTALRTFARVVPSDYIQALAQVRLQKSLGCKRTYAISDGEYDGDSAKQAFLEAAQAQGLDVVGEQSYSTSESSYISNAQTVAASGANCVLIAALAGENTIKLVTQVARENPGVRLFATSGLAESSFTDPARHGIPADVGRRLLITAPGGNPKVNSLTRAFIAAYRREGFGTPEPAAIDGYAAMRLVLEAIQRATDDGRHQAERVNVVKALFSLGKRASPLGAYQLKPDGDTTLRYYDVYRVVGGRLQYWKTVRG